MPLSPLRYLNEQLYQQNPSFEAINFFKKTADDIRAQFSLNKNLYNECCIIEKAP